MVSHKHKCIFIHIPKTAGMSIEDAFLRSLGLEFYQGQCPALLLSYNKDRSMGPPSLAHLKPEDYVSKSYLSEELFHDYFKFSFIRNPWARVVSIYKYFKYHRLISFENFLIHKFPELWEDRFDFVMPQVNFLFDNKENQLVDFIGKFEYLEEDFETVKNKIEYPIGALKHINKSPKPHNWYSRWNRRFVFSELKNNPQFIKYLNLFVSPNAPYQSYYTKKSKEVVYTYYKKDIEKLGYKF